MGKMTNALIIAFTLELSIVMLAGAEYIKSSFYKFLLSPELWNLSGFMGWLGIAMVSIGTGAIIVGSFLSKSDWIWRATLATAFFTFATSSIVRLSSLMSSSGHFGDANLMITAMFIAPILLYYIMACVDFVGAKD